MASDIGWELYRSFLGVLKEGSLSGAARALGIAQPTVGRHIAALEKALGLALFTRSQAGLHAHRGGAITARLCRIDAKHGWLRWSAPPPARARECAVPFA